MMGRAMGDGLRAAGSVGARSYLGLLALSRRVFVLMWCCDTVLVICIA